MSVEQLRERLSDEIENNGLKNINVFWGPEAGKLTPDERAGHVLDMLNACKEWNEKSDEEKMRIQIKQAYESLSEVIDLCKTDLSKPFNLEDAKRRSEIFCGIESAMMLLGNWVDREDLTKIRNKRRETR